MVVKETKFSKETKVAKEVIVISSSDDEVTSDDEVLSDDAVSSFKFKDLYFKYLKGFLFKGFKGSKTSKVSTSSASKSKAFTSKNNHNSFQMDATGGSGSNSPVWPIVDDNGAVDMNATMDNLEYMISNLEKVFAWDEHLGPNPSTVPKRKIPNLNPHTGLFVNHRRSIFKCDFVSSDSRLELRKSTMDISFTLGYVEEVNNLRILQS
ncbi:hypothetical protein Tco_1563887 [Tanacetum coccineum]